MMSSDFRKFCKEFGLGYGEYYKLSDAEKKIVQTEYKKDHLKKLKARKKPLSNTNTYETD